MDEQAVAVKFRPIPSSFSTAWRGGCLFARLSSGLSMTLSA